ncbi:hypothetical protein SUGI_0287190 [Cryptomeria japonica]|nr:hypothetical protein SUGI_0287190 [Cryptomeria japonica]
MDLLKGFPAEISLKVAGRCWVQPVDYEKIVSRCGKCFLIDHFTSQCQKSTTHERGECGNLDTVGKASWWIRAEPQDYVVPPNNQTETNLSHGGPKSNIRSNVQ